MKTPLIKSNKAMFPRKTGHWFGYRNPAMAFLDKKKNDERDIRFITDEEKKAHQKTNEKMKNRPEMKEEYQTGINKRKPGQPYRSDRLQSIQPKGKTDTKMPTKRNPISFSQL